MHIHCIQHLLAITTILPQLISHFQLQLQLQCIFIEHRAKHCLQPKVQPSITQSFCGSQRLVAFILNYSCKLKHFVNFSSRLRETDETLEISSMRQTFNKFPGRLSFCPYFSMEISLEPSWRVLSALPINMKANCK